MKKRTTYDLGLKIMVTNEYALGNATYSSLSEKYGVPSPTIAKCISFLLLERNIYQPTPLL